MWPVACRWAHDNHVPDPLAWGFTPAVSKSTANNTTFNPLCTLSRLVVVIGLCLSSGKFTTRRSVCANAMVSCIQPPTHMLTGSWLMCKRTMSWLLKWLSPTSITASRTQVCFTQSPAKSARAYSGMWIDSFLSLMNMACALNEVPCSRIRASGREFNVLTTVVIISLMTMLRKALPHGGAQTIGSWAWMSCRRN